MSKELTLYEDGRVVLTSDGGELVWSSDNDDAFQKEFGETIDPDEVEAVLDFLDDEGYLEEGETVDVVDLGSEADLDDDDEDYGGADSDEDDEDAEVLH